MITTIQTIGIVLQLVLSIAGKSSSSEIDNIVTILEEWLPTLLKEAEDLVPVVQQIITTLQGNSTLTDDQKSAIDALNAQVDADFDAAAKATGEA